MMGYLLLNFDVKWSNRDYLEGGYFPPNKAFGIIVSPSENETVMFRRRTQD